MSGFANVTGVIASLSSIISVLKVHILLDGFMLIWQNKANEA